MKKITETPKIIGAATITAMLMIGVYVLIIHNKPPASVASTSVVAPVQNNAALATSAQSSPAVVTTSPSSAAVVTPAPTTSSTYKDGTYKASANYRVPEGGVNRLSISITIQNDTISDISATHDISEFQSQAYTNSFDQNLKGMMVGKKMGSMSMSRIGAASLTSSAFFSALNSVIASAKS